MQARCSLSAGPVCIFTRILDKLLMTTPGHFGFFETCHFVWAEGPQEQSTGLQPCEQN